MAKNFRRTLESVFFEKYPEYRNIIKKRRLFSNESLTEGIYIPDENGLLVKVEKDTIYAQLSECLREIGVEEINRQKSQIKGFLQKFERSESEFDFEGEKYFVTHDVTILLENLKRKNFSTISEMLACKDLWMTPTVTLKDKCFTRYSEIHFPEKVEEFVFKAAIDKIYSVLLRCMGWQKESVEDFLNLIAAALYGIRMADYFLLFQGVGGTGKNLILDLLKELLGLYYEVIDTEKFLSSKPSVMQELFSKKEARIISIQEPSEERKKVALLKKVTGRSTLMAENQKFVMQSLFLIDSNFPVESTVEDSGLERRSYILPFGPKITEDEQNREMIEELRPLLPYFLLELCRRFSNIEIKDIKCPKITKSVLFWNRIERQKNYTQAFMDIMCTSSVEEGKEMSLKEIREIFKSKFPSVFAEYRKKNLFWLDGDAFALKIQKTTAQEFDAVFSTRFQNQGLKNGYTTVRHIVIGNPGEYGTMENREIEDLKCRLQLDEEAARAKIEEARKPSAARIKDNPFEEDCRDLLCYRGPWGLAVFGIIDGDRKKWKKEVINRFKYNMNMLKLFQIQFVNEIMAQEESERLIEILIEKLNELKSFPEDWFSDVTISDVLDEIFDAFAKWVRNDLSRQKKISITDPSICLSPLNMGMTLPFMPNLFFSPPQPMFGGNQPQCKLILGKKS